MDKVVDQTPPISNGLTMCDELTLCDLFDFDCFAC
jgi:hypothetical protein